MRALSYVKAACFTTDYLDPNDKEVIGEFGKCVKELHNQFKISIINKWHIITVKVPQWTGNFQKPLGSWKFFIKDIKNSDRTDSLSRTKEQVSRPTMSSSAEMTFT